MFFKITILLLTLFTGSNKLYSQQITGMQTTCASSGQGISGTVKICYTVGEMPDIKSFKTGGFFLTQGIMQPLVLPPPITFNCFSNLELSLAPNPTRGSFYLNIGILEKGHLETQIIATTGQVLQRQETAYNGFSQQTFDIKLLPAGVYFLNVIFKSATATRRCAYQIEKIN